MRADLLGKPLYVFTGEDLTSQLRFNTPSTLTPASEVAATSASPDFSLIHFKLNINDYVLNGQFYTANKVIGHLLAEKSEVAIWRLIGKGPNLHFADPSLKKA